MPKLNRIYLLLCVALVVAIFGISGCATNSPAVSKDALAYDIVYEITSSAALTKVEYSLKPYKGADRLHIALTLKNISSETKRFRVNIFLPDGTSGGGLYPRKIKDDAKGISPGEEHSREFPMIYNELPSGFTILVKELG